MYRILVTGSRDWPSEKRVRHAIIHKVLEVGENDPKYTNRGETDWVALVHGACPTGADYFAQTLADICNWPVEKFPADWVKHGKRAGPIRNEEMMKTKPDVCLAFVKDNSSGTTGTIRLARKYKVPVEVYHDPMPALLRRK